MEPEVDKRKIYGRVISLVVIKDVKYAKALEYIAGGKLFYVVVDSDQTSKHLLEAGCFIKRETCIPNNKISYQDVSNTVHWC